MMVTIKDIARESGYSISTVSRVLSNHPDVSQKARDTVKLVVDKYKFVPNSNAKQLKQQDTNIIAIIVKGTNNMIFARIVERLQVEIEKKGYTAIVNYLDEDANEVLEALQLCKESKALGLLFLGGNMEYFKNGFSDISVPSVLITNSAEQLNFQNLSSVFVDDAKGAFSAIDYLINHGHKKIGIIGGNIKHSYTSYLRLQGCLECFEQNNIFFNKDTQYENARYSFESGYNAMMKLLKKTDLTAVFCMSDVMAIGAIRALRDKNFNIPDDISVVGYDGIELSEYYNPKIVTIRQHHDKLALVGLQILINYFENNSDAVHKVIPFELIEGESVRHWM